MEVFFCCINSPHSSSVWQTEYEILFQITQVTINLNQYFKSSLLGKKYTLKWNFVWVEFKIVVFQRKNTTACLPRYMNIIWIKYQHISLRFFYAISLFLSLPSSLPHSISLSSLSFSLLSLFCLFFSFSLSLPLLPTLSDTLSVVHITSSFLFHWCWCWLTVLRQNNKWFSPRNGKKYIKKYYHKTTSAYFILIKHFASSILECEFAFVFVDV